MDSAATYPVRVEARLDAPLSRWLWLVKWALIVPHIIALVFAWLAFGVLTVIAFFAILFTARYPPFTLEDDPGSAAHLDVEYPERLSRGLVLIKWWLLAIPQYLIVAIFAGGSGLIGILALIAAVVLGVTGSYPAGIYDLVLGMNRWVLRVAAYAGLMTDRYPPFRLDMGGREPTGKGG